MIISGYSSMNEKVTGELADALKSMPTEKKSKFIKSIGDVDFNRSIGKATIIKSSRDARLKDSGNIIIGVYTNADDNKKYMVAYRPGVGTLSEDKNVSVINKSGEIIKISNFGDLSWAKWLSLMSSVYVITQDSAVFAKELRDNRYKKYEGKNKNRKAIELIKSKCGFNNELLTLLDTPSIDLEGPYKNKNNSMKLYIKVPYDVESENSILKKFINNLSSWRDTNNLENILPEVKNVFSSYDIISILGLEGTYSRYSFIKEYNNNIITIIPTVISFKDIATYYTLTIQNANFAYETLRKRAEEKDAQLKQYQEELKRREQEELEFINNLTYDKLLERVKEFVPDKKLSIIDDNSFKIILNASSFSSREKNSKIQNKLYKLFENLKETKRPKYFNTYEKPSGRGEDTEGGTTYKEGSDFYVEHYFKTSRSRVKDTEYYLITRK